MPGYHDSFFKKMESWQAHFSGKKSGV